LHVFHHWQGFTDQLGKLVVGLGNFDGVHIGHQRLICEVRDIAREIGGVPALITFYPHPTAVLQPDSCPPMLLSQESKQELIAALQIDALFQLTFDEEFAKIQPETFIKEILHQGLNAQGVVVGYNFTFGQFGRGTPDLLAKWAPCYGYRLSVVPPVTLDGEVVSSTLIRTLLKNGCVAEAARFLGYYSFVEGLVVPGEKRGGVLGFPTANIDIVHSLLVPANGVYSVVAHVGETKISGLANVGYKPTFEGRTRNVEVHLLDFAQDLYGQVIKVEFIQRIREEKKFISSEDLVRQIEQDILTVRAFT